MAKTECVYLTPDIEKKSEVLFTNLYSSGDYY